MKKQLVFFLLGCLLTNTVRAQFLKIDDVSSYDLRSKSFVYLEDKNGKMTIQDVKAVSPDQFLINDLDVFNFGFTQSTYWLKTTIQNGTTVDELMFEIGQTNTDIVELYFDNEVQLVSDLTKFTDRLIPDPKPVFKMPIKPDLYDYNND